MSSDFATQIGVTRLPNLTGDGRDGFPSRAQHDWCVAQYLSEMCEKKRGKALIDKNLYDRILAVCFDDSNKKTETAQFRWWVRRTFKLYSEPHGHYLMHENRPVAVKEQIYDILIYAHAECGHGGRDKTSAAVRRYFSWIPKDVVSRFVSVCPGCHARTQKDDEYFSNKGIDGYYPVHDKVRQMSIDSRRTSVDDYRHTSSYQPLLAAGMVKILKAIEGARSFIPSPDNSSPIREVPSATQQTSYLYAPGHHLAHFPPGSNCHSPLSHPQTPLGPPMNFVPGMEPAPVDIYRENFPAQLDVSFGTSYLNVSPPFAVPAYANNQLRSLSLPIIGFSADTSSGNDCLQVPIPSTNPEKLPSPRVINARSKSQCSPFHHIAKPPRPSTGRKLSSKSKEYKKTVIAECFAPSPETYCSKTYYDSQSPTQSLTHSEDDGTATSKSSFSSPPACLPTLQHQEMFQDYSFSQSSSLNMENIQSLGFHAQVGPYGEYRLDNSNVDFSSFGGLLPSHQSYPGQYVGDALLGGVQVGDTWNAGNEPVCDYSTILPELLNSQIFDHSPDEFCHLVSLQTPDGLTDPLTHDVHSQSAFPALDSWSSSSATQELGDAHDPCYQTLYLPITQGQAGLFHLENQSGSSDINTHHQPGFVFSNSDSFGDSSSIEPPSSFQANSLGINFSEEFQFGPNPIY
ncbi:hypothetical protein PCANC_16912 [Puccinia coronata f. sp. avenae]|uniref:Integrase zinc-binding domain-containing protein n=1 Tax=Puccinia coronata f. sp. avenae TaxID=200324 RepID=A0A2N5SNP3_9BASI|nr:hypothetical protein PCANC_16912 [Puccinia coronata f. sp. avenae]PLW51867.1 hypothetical protein PCASD_00906 [Puccinia coronata f. sp. avenae]